MAPQNASGRAAGPSSSGARRDRPPNALVPSHSAGAHGHANGHAAGGNGHASPAARGRTHSTVDRKAAPRKPGPKTPWCVIQYDDRDEDALGLWQKLVAINRDACESMPNNGCRYLFYRKPLDPSIEPHYWQKVVALDQALDTCQRAVWLDTDAVITGSPAEFDVHFGGKDIFVTPDPPAQLVSMWGSWYNSTFNAGVLGVRSTECGRSAMKAWRDLYPRDLWHKPAHGNGSWSCSDGKFECPYANADSYEQGAFAQHILNTTNFSSCIHVASAARLNAPCETDSVATQRHATACHFMSAEYKAYASSYLQSRGVMIMPEMMRKLFTPPPSPPPEALPFITATQAGPFLSLHWAVVLVLALAVVMPCLWCCRKMSALRRQLDAREKLIQAA